jgi:hypothetical protein
MKENPVGTSKAKISNAGQIGHHRAMARLLTLGADLAHKYFNLLPTSDIGKESQI